MKIHQSKIEKLIAELCPNGVEFKALNSLVEISTGKLNANAMKEDGQYPFFTCAEKPFLIDKYSFDTEAILVSGNGSQVGHINYYKGKFNAYQRTYVLSNFSNEVSVHFLLFCLRGFLKKYILKNVKEGSVPYITLPMLHDFKIPLPPLAVQEEIVKILNSFTELETELETELKARKKQYEHYKESLFTFSDEIKCISLRDICDIGDGLHGTPKYNESGDYHFINGNNLKDGQIQFDSKTKKVDNEIYKKHGILFFKNKTIFMSINGTIGSVSLFNNENIVLGKSVSYFNVKSDLLDSKFLFYFLQTNFAKNYFELQKTGSTIKNLGLKALREFKIPLPLISEQQRLVLLLDKFDALVNDISIGLPAELSARRSQYEYYRGKLLTFNEYDR